MAFTDIKFDFLPILADFQGQISDHWELSPRQKRKFVT